MEKPSFASRLLDEWRLTSSDKWLTTLLGWLPLALFLLVWAIFSSGTGRNLPIGVVDLDHSAMSRSLTRYYDASPTLETQSFSSVQEATASLNSAETYATVIIPSDFEKATLRGESPEVTAFYNSQYILIGKLVNAAITQSQSTFAAMVETKGKMLHGTTVSSQAAGQSVPVRFQLVPLFNNGTNYAQFLVSAIIPALWQIVIVASGMLSMALTDKRIGLENHFKQGLFSALIAKVVGLLVPLWLMGVVFATAMHFGLGWPMNGSWTLLFASQGLMVSAGLAVGSLLYLGTRDATRAMSLVAGFTAPAFAFMGVSFPASDMPFLAQCWRAMLPVSHYITVQIGQFNYGATLLQMQPMLLALAAFSLIWLLVATKLKRLCRSATLIQEAGI
ncbi:ABC-type multidrug transport system, permease component [Grimontia indica]|uniref:ABC-type multidrug transport system, permease component n=1 Tax=Grimontia indica TaxID=1056512 RepID=R1IXL0_9GAMM|nr:ABC transporter permease [Grimontia indica]EOD80035.1 ABC-type multidrug transport system, permease component [Grimontia indica]